MRVAIVGAGPCGLTAIKCCLDEGLQPVCFEKGTDLGGLWRYSTTEKDHTSVYNSCVMVTSKEMSCYSDFPVPKEYPLYLPRSLAQKYLNLYADKFKLRPHIRYNSKIEKINHQKGPDMNDQWQVTYQERLPENYISEQDIDDTCITNDGSLVTEMFDAVLICSGHHWKPSIPNLLGADKFLGDIIHSSAYKDSKKFHGKNVLVVGIGDSGAAIACELSQDGGNIYLSSRRGCWITSRLKSFGIPADQVLQRRIFFDSPRKILDWVCMKLINHHFDHHDFGLLPSHSYLEQPPVVNDYLPYKILSGAVRIKPDVVRLTERDAHFEDGSVAENLDVVILATGYQYNYPFLEEGCVEFKGSCPVLYKYMFPVEENPTIAWIGSVQPVGCMFSVAEMQARVATRVFKGLIKLPSVKEMEFNIKKREERKRIESYDAVKHATTVYYIPYCNDLADMVGCKPRLSTLLFSDPLLAFRYYFGPCSPPQYRLTGPGAWDGARRAIMALPERSVYHMKKEGKRHGCSRLFIYTLVAVLVYAVLLFLWKPSLEGI